jgi:hypothetical protein
MLETILTVETMNIIFQLKDSCINIENIRESAQATGVNIQTLGDNLGHLRNTSHNVKNNCNGSNI